MDKLAVQALADGNIHPQIMIVEIMSRVLFNIGFTSLVVVWFPPSGTASTVNHGKRKKRMPRPTRRQRAIA